MLGEICVRTSLERGSRTVPNLNCIDRKRRRDYIMQGGEVAEDMVKSRNGFNSNTLIRRIPVRKIQTTAPRIADNSNPSAEALRVGNDRLVAPHGNISMGPGLCHRTEKKSAAVHFVWHTTRDCDQIVGRVTHDFNLDNPTSKGGSSSSWNGLLSSSAVTRISYRFLFVRGHRGFGRYMCIDFE